jgi:hypothetical protein
MEKAGKTANVALAGHRASRRVTEEGKTLK